MTTTAPTGEAQHAPRPVDWTAHPYDLLPKEQRHIVEAYEFGVAGPRDACAVTADDLRDVAVAALEDGLSAAAHVDARVQLHLAALERWYERLDTLDHDLRDSRGQHTATTREIVSVEASQMQDAVQALHRAVIAYHHAATGPVPARAYGGAYEFFSGTVHPAASSGAIAAISPAGRERQARVAHVLRAKAAEIMALGEANDWSIWAAQYLHPDVEFVNTGEQSGESLAAAVKRQHRSEALHDAIEAVAALIRSSRADDPTRDSWCAGVAAALELLWEKANGAPSASSPDPVTTALHWGQGTDAVVTVDEQSARGHYLGVHVEPGGAPDARILNIRVLVCRPGTCPDDTPDGGEQP
ncbi:hypothetical protein ABZ883_04650 [Streptomyces sp. NPDC046977]|uniref:hypothetical protein n=1 Tax=Streptomyces sp. NPDC046977 TaxID=3154703 RepID=UPI0033C9E210